MATVHLAEPLRRFTDGHETVSVPGETSGEALEHLFTRYPRLRARVLDAGQALHPHLLLFHNGAAVPRPEAMSRPVAPDDTLEIEAAMAGGAGDAHDSSAASASACT